MRRLDSIFYKMPDFAGSNYRFFALDPNFGESNETYQAAAPGFFDGSREVVLLSACAS